MNISEKDREYVLKAINGAGVYFKGSKSIGELINGCINNMSYEEAMEIVKTSKKYIEFKGIDDSKASDVVKVLVKYVNKFYATFSEFKCPDVSTSTLLEFYNNRVNYYDMLIEELNSDNFTFSKIKVMLVFEKIFVDYQELSECSGLSDINNYIRENMYSIISILANITVMDDLKNRDYYLYHREKSSKRKRR